jgi:hypothetical protein
MYSKLPNDHKIYQMVVIYSHGHRIYQLFLFQGPQKLIQIWIFGKKINVPSGNPDGAVVQVEEQSEE